MFRLNLACVLSVNTEKRVGVDWPRTYGAAVSLDTGEVFTAAFESHGPDADIRYVGTQGVRESNNESDQINVG